MARLSLTRATMARKRCLLSIFKVKTTGFRRSASQTQECRGIIGCRDKIGETAPWISRFAA
jgi:hypothetical protein